MSIAIDHLQAEEWSGAKLNGYQLPDYFWFVPLHCRARVSSVIWLKSA